MDLDIETKEILAKFAMGYDITEIAETLPLDEHTVGVKLIEIFSGVVDYLGQDYFDAIEKR